MADNLIKLVKIQEDDEGEDQWIVTFEYRANGRTWFTANIPVPKSVDEEAIVPYARHILHEVCRTARDATIDWKVNSDKMQVWQAGGL